jgi:hypothetical protein
MVACHFNFQFQVLALLKGTKELGVAHFTMDTPQCGHTPTIFVIFVLDVATIKRLVEVHNKHIEGQDFVVSFEVCKRNFHFSFVFFSFWFANFFMKFPI